MHIVQSRLSGPILSTKSLGHGVHPLNGIVGAFLLLLLLLLSKVAQLVPDLHVHLEVFCHTSINAHALCCVEVAVSVLWRNALCVAVVDDPNHRIAH
jgi:hypothetical protein